jgi:hypothetical protein
MNMTDSEKIDALRQEVATLTCMVRMLEQLIRGTAPINQFGSPLGGYSGVANHCQAGSWMNP